LGQAQPRRINELTVGYFVSHFLSHPLFIIKACIIIHNLIIEDERNIDNANDIEYEQIDETSYVQISHEDTPAFMEFIEMHMNIRDSQIHS
jgi:hypothetical protein